MEMPKNNAVIRAALSSEMINRSSVCRILVDVDSSSAAWHIHYLKNNQTPVMETALRSFHNGGLQLVINRY